MSWHNKEKFSLSIYHTTCMLEIDSHVSERSFCLLALLVFLVVLLLLHWQIAQVP